MSEAEILSAASTEAEMVLGAAPVRISVCTLCSDRRRGGLRTGRWLLADLIEAARGTGFEVGPIACVSVCRPLIALTLSAEDKWTHVFAVPSDTDPKHVLEAARLYARSRTGLFVWEGCEVLREAVVARVPPTR